MTWTFINLTLNMFGLWFTKLLNPEEFAYLDSIRNEFIKPLAIQSLLFGVCSVAAYLLLKNKKAALYGFVALQFLVFHVVFFLNIKISNGIHFATTFGNPGLQYLSNCGQYMVDILYLYFPVNGNFENGQFMPYNIGTFYIHWILLNLMYYFGLTWLAVKTATYFFVRPEKKPITEKGKKVAPEVKD